MRAICGIDWASQWHDARIADANSGEKNAQRRFVQDEAGISALINAPIGHQVQRVAIERRRAARRTPAAAAAQHMVNRPGFVGGRGS